MSERPATDARVVRRWLGAARPAGPGSALSGPTTAFTAPTAFGNRALEAEGWNDELPGTSLELVLELDGAWDLEIGGQHASTGAFTAGLVAGRVRTRAIGPIRLVQLSIDPLAAPALFGLPAGALGGAIVELGSILDREAPRLLDQLDAAMGDGDFSSPHAASTAVHAAERWAQERVRRAEAEHGPFVPADVRRACDLMRASGGALRVQTVADELGCSRRHLTRRFNEYVGLVPSQFTRLIRFERATNTLRRDPARPLGRLAFECNYADHAHMDREFRALAGAPPSAVAARFAA